MIDGGEETEHYVHGRQMLYVSEALILVVYIIWTHVFEHYWMVRWLHQTTVAALLGVIAGILLPFAGVEASLDPSVVLNVCLPLIIIDAGYNLNIWDFFDHWVYIVLLGIFGTLGFFNLVSWFYSGGQLGTLTDGHAMIVALVFSASDTVAPLTLLPHRKHRKLNAIVFGEAIMNDVVCLFLATTVRHVTRDSSMCSLRTPARFTALSNMTCSIKMKDVMIMALIDIGISTLLGVVWGMLTSWTLGVFRSVFKNGPVSRPCILVLLSCYVAYIGGDFLNLSGVMVMFVCAVVCKVGVVSNLHIGMGDLLSSITELLGFSSESFLFGYFGISLAREFRIWHRFLWHKVGIGLLCVAFCRLVVVGVARMTVEMISFAPFISDKTRGRLRLNTAETVMVASCGMVRGVIAIALLLTLESQKGKRTIQEQQTHQVLTLVMTIHILSAGPLMSFLKGFLRLAEDKFQDETSKERAGRKGRFALCMADLLAVHGRHGSRVSTNSSRSSSSSARMLTEEQKGGIEMVELSEDRRLTL